MKAIRIFAFSIIFLAPFLSSNKSLGHHNAAIRYDVDSIAELTGEFVEIRWVNPHIKMSFRTSDGEIWKLEGLGITYIYQRGITEDAIPIGKEVTIAGLPSKLGLSEMFITNLLSPNCEEFLLAGVSVPQWPLGTNFDAYSCNRDNN